MITYLTEPFALPFMVRALVAASLASAACAVVGTYVVLRGMAFLGDALAHSILPGVAIGYLLGRGDRSTVLWWALATAAGAALAMGAMARRARLKEDTAIGIVLAAMFALGIALISTVRGYAVDLNHFLFGNVLAVSPQDLWLMAGLAAGVIFTVVLLYRELLITSFDPVLAATLRLPARALHNLLLILVAATVVLSLQAVGVALTLALLVTPPTTGYLLAHRLPTMMALGVVSGLLSAILGIYLSYYAGIATGPSIVLVATGLFLTALVLSPKRRTLLSR
ncbi:MAG: metal ABC transporter permease [Candidatus Bipolaricaulota bacterium]